MKRTLAAALAVGTLATLGTPVAAQAQGSRGATSDPRILAYDKGPVKINVSKYPAEMKNAYKVFDKRCSACHTLARAVNCEYVLDDEWQRYIRQMMEKSGTLISPDEAKEIFTFVTYDSRTRKKELYDKKLAAAGTR
jgi:cytochrome c5